MQKYFLILFFLCAGFSSSLSQSPHSQRTWYRSWYLSWYRPLYQTEMDSLKKILINSKDTARINCLNELAVAYDWIKPDSEIIIARQAYREALNTNYLTGVATSLLSMGLAGLSKGNFSASESYFREAIPFLEKVGNTFLLGQCFTYLGRGLDRQAYFEESMKCYDKAFSYFRIINDSIDIANLFVFRGDIYQNKGEYEKSFESYKKGLQIINAQSHEEEASFGYYGILWGYYNMGNLYRNVGDYQMALSYYHEGKNYTSKNHLFFYTEAQILEAIGITFCLMQQYDSSLYYLGHVRDAYLETSMSIQISLGETYLMQKRYKEALNLFLVQLENARKNNSRIFVMRALYDIGKAYTETQQNNSALRYIRELLPIAQETGMQQYIRDAAHLLSIIYANNKQFDSSYKFLQLHTVLKDSIESKLYLFRLARNKDEVEVEKKNAEIKLLNKDKQIQREQISRESFIRQVLIVGIFILTLLGIIIVRVIMLKRKNEAHRHELTENESKIQQLESKKQLAELEMQALRAQMNPHFIFNSLNSINMFILENNKLQATEYLTKFSRLIRMILNSSANASVNLAEDLEALQLYLELESLRFKKKFTYKIECDPEIDADFIQMPPMLLQPFVENAIWHGLMNKEGEGHLSINMQQEDSLLICTITDDGIGRKKAAELKDKSGKHKSMGMKITESRIAMMQKMNGENKSIEIRDLVDANGNAAGTEVALKIPVVGQAKMIKYFETGTI